MLPLMKRKIQVPQQVPGCPSCLLTCCVQMFLLGWGRGMVTEEPAFLCGKGKRQCMCPSWGPAWAHAAPCSPFPSTAGSPGPTRSISIFTARKDTTSASSWLKPNVISKILAAPFSLHRRSAHHMLTLGRSLTLWGILLSI